MKKEQLKRLQWALGTLAVLMLAIHGYILLKVPSSGVEVIPEQGQREPEARKEASAPEAARKESSPVEAPADPRDRASQKEVEQVGEALRKALASFRLTTPTVRKSGEAYTVSIPHNLNIHRLQFELMEQLGEVDGKIVKAIEDRRRDRMEYTVEVDGDWACRIVLMQRESISALSGRMAIIVDDFGYANNELVRKFLYYPKPLTIAILPGQKASGVVARDARVANREILVHMPMEPLNERFSDEGYTLLAGQDAGTARLRVRAALAQIPHAIGINNHQGSRVTADRVLMKAVMTELKRQDKLFVDSRTSSKSVALQVARELGLRAGANQVFLDAEDKESFIEGQFEKAAAIAGKQGEVIAICHMRKRTFKVLERMIPRLEQQGIRFVYLSEVL
ncbi:MAG TPA: divergent polysaccharide deacetylase family protein [bacterium]|nr:divergent polysaccharide deacetylase family protein [bacterium]HPG84416.1 divergent polysaccharide deacetylase family protein [bacterium]HPM59613.1 divergent polysaccharide deacetylase family protein [bacterium]